MFNCLLDIHSVGAYRQFLGRVKPKGIPSVLLEAGECMSSLFRDAGCFLLFGVLSYFELKSNTASKMHSAVIF